MTDTHPEFAEDIRNCTAGQGIAEEAALEKGMEKKLNEFAEKGAT